MNIQIPGLTEIIGVVKNMPEQFEALVSRMDRMIELQKETNLLLREANKVALRD